MAKRKGKQFGNRGFTASNEGAVREQLKQNAILVERVALARKRRGIPLSANKYISLETTK